MSSVVQSRALLTDSVGAVTPITILWGVMKRADRVLRELERAAHRPDAVTFQNQQQLFARLRRTVAELREKSNAPSISGELLNRIDQCLERVDALEKKPLAPIRIIGGYLRRSKLA